MSDRGQKVRSVCKFVAPMRPQEKGPAAKQGQVYGVEAPPGRGGEQLVSGKGRKVQSRRRQFDQGQGTIPRLVRNGEEAIMARRQKWPALYRPSVLREHRLSGQLR